MYTTLPRLENPGRWTSPHCRLDSELQSSRLSPLEADNLMADGKLVDVSTVGTNGKDELAGVKLQTLQPTAGDETQVKDTLLLLFVWVCDPQLAYLPFTGTSDICQLSPSWDAREITSRYNVSQSSTLKNSRCRKHRSQRTKTQQSRQKSRRKTSKKL